MHVLITGCALLGVAGLLTRRRRPALIGLGGWLAGTAEFAWRRLRPGPFGRTETGTMLLTSAVIPPAATWYWIRGLLSRPGAGPQPGE